jgi:restriction endonuclease S subunit
MTFNSNGNTQSWFVQGSSNFTMTVNWSDGSINNYTGADNYQPTHTYSTQGDYIATITLSNSSLITYLDVSTSYGDNRLKNITGLEFLTSLNTLILGGNLLTSFDPSPLVDSVSTLDLSYNDLTTFAPTLPLPYGLVNLYLNDNSITNFEKLTKDKLPANAKNIVEYGNILISCVRPKKSKMLLITENIKNIDNYVFSTALANIKLKDKNSAYYIYSILYCLVDNFENELCNGSSYPRFKPADLLNVKIPIPKSKQKITEWVNKISKPYDKKNKNEELIMKLEEQIRDKIKDIGENEDCDEVELGSICDIVSGSKTNLQQYLVKNSSHKIIRTRNLIDSNDYLYLNDEGINKCKTKILNKGDILMSTFADSYICKIIPDNFIGSTYNGGLFKINNLKISSIYFINYIMMDNFKEQIKKISGGSTVLLFNIDNLKKLKIKIPKNKKLIKDLEPLFQELEKLQSEIKEADLQYKKLIKELSEEAIPNNQNDNSESNQNIINNNSEESETNQNIINEDEEIQEEVIEKVKPKRLNLKR